MPIASALSGPLKGQDENVVTIKSTLMRVINVNETMLL
jgi:hypothetical protein